MKLIVVMCLVAAAASSPPLDVQLLSYDHTNTGAGGFRYSYELSDGTKHESKGELKNEGSDDEALSVSGSYGWVGPDGITYTVKYVADENGFQPQIEQGPGGGVPAGVVASLLG